MIDALLKIARFGFKSFFSFATSGEAGLADSIGGGEDDAIIWSDVICR